jgi:hypothetical protein
VTAPEAWAVLAFDGPTPADVVEEQIVRALRAGGADPEETVELLDPDGGPDEADPEFEENHDWENLNEAWGE